MVIISNTSTKIIQNGNKSFNKWWWDNSIATCQRIKLAVYLTPYTEINSKWIKDIHVRAETKIFTRFGNRFLGLTPPKV